MDLEDSDYQEEWKALQVTYPELDLPNEPPRKGSSFQLRIRVDLNKSYTVDVVDSEATDNAQSRGTIQVSHLPPILINISLPSSYPQELPPAIISLQATHNWLPSHSLQKLAADLKDIWDREKCIILALWVNHIQDGRELLESLQLLDDDEKICLHSHTSGKSDLIHSLREHDNVAKERNFNSSKYRCPVCFDRLQGTDCIALSFCEHVACKRCLKAGWSLHISEGRPELVACPYTQCVKSNRLASIQDVQAVLSEQEIIRWQWLIRKQETERDPTIVFCPQISCQRPVHKGTSLEDGWEGLRICECGFTFCVYCRRTWHGPHLACPFPSSADFVKTYIELPANSPEKMVFEQRHGRKNLAKLVAKYQEDKLNLEWLKRETMACPGCQIRVEKTMGCNHMKCVKCGQHFCYRCGARIKASDPYLHFSTKGISCYSKLFDNLNGGDDDDGWINLD